MLRFSGGGNNNTGQSNAGPHSHADTRAVLTDAPFRMPHWDFRVIVLEDNDVLHLSGGGYGIFNTEQSDVEEAVTRVLLTLEVEVEQIMKVRRRWYLITCLCVNCLVLRSMII